MNTVDTRKTEEYLEQLNGFENHYGYDTGYLKELLQSSPEGYAKFDDFTPLARHRQYLRVEQFWVAKLVAMQVEDCGACLQLNVRMALEEGIDPALIKAVLDNNKELPASLQPLAAYSRQVAANEPIEAELRQSVEKLLSKDQLLELGIAIATTKIFPTIKRTLGYARSCSLMDIAV